MDVMTGPQGTPAQRDELAELAGIYGMSAVLDGDGPWLDVDTLYCAPGWTECPLALADATIAKAFGVKCTELLPLREYLR